MSKAKVESTNSPQSGGSSVSRAPVKINSTQIPVWYKVLIFGSMLVGLGWLLVNYIAGPHIPFTVTLNAWDYVIDFGLFIVGLLMTMGWCQPVLVYRAPQAHPLLDAPSSYLETQVNSFPSIHPFPTRFSENEDSAPTDRAKKLSTGTYVIIV